MPLTLGDVFPNFDAEALGVESFNLYNYLGDSWGIMFSHPNDFTPVCTTELAEAVKLHKKFAEKKCKLVGFSCNDMNSHKFLSDVLSALGECGGHLICSYVIIAARCCAGVG
ncbi:uncharacterized protein EMH_0085180 [Eimeria mitis]|uniref:Thioredoxin domain-containing protein n=1 Tax=Eimeria mitis TaxID=44415 RepID=U6KAB5_9EIME|nr:uncharacterized protein EMH_0085180 [Eimeria mitis]CDJ33756.1 hypothetical protein, conserved [Eimeria mitis]